MRCTIEVSHSPIHTHQWWLGAMQTTNQLIRSNLVLGVWLCCAVVVHVVGPGALESVNRIMKSSKYGGILPKNMVPHPWSSNLAENELQDQSWSTYRKERWRFSIGSHCPQTRILLKICGEIWSRQCMQVCARTPEYFWAQIVSQGRKTSKSKNRLSWLQEISGSCYWSAKEGVTTICTDRVPKLLHVLFPLHHVYLLFRWCFYPDIIVATPGLEQQTFLVPVMYIGHRLLHIWNLY